MPVQKGRFWEGRAKHKLLRPYRNSGVLTKNFATYEEAQRWETNTRRQLANGILPEELGDDDQVISRIGHAIKAYLAANAIKESDKETLLITYGRLGNELLKDIDYAWAERWLAHMKQTHALTPNTIRKHVGSLARCLDWLIRAQKSTLVSNPLRVLPRGYAIYNELEAAKLKAKGVETPTDESRDRRLEEGEEPRIRHIFAGGVPEGRRHPMRLHEPAHLEAMFTLALESAMRLSEMYTLTAGQVDLTRRTVFLERTKNGDKRQVPITSVAQPILAKLIEGKTADELIFPWYGQKEYQQMPERERRKAVTAMLSQRYARVFAAAKCEGLHFHDLRHEATSRLFERTTLNDVQIMKITGHKSKEMLMRYANLRGSELADHLW